MAINPQIIKVGIQAGESDPQLLGLLKYLRGNPTSRVKVDINGANTIAKTEASSTPRVNNSSKIDSTDKQIQSAQKLALAEEKATYSLISTFEKREQARQKATESAAQKEASALSKQEEMAQRQVAIEAKTTDRLIQEFTRREAARQKKQEAEEKAQARRDVQSQKTYDRQQAAQARQSQRQNKIVQNFGKETDQELFLAHLFHGGNAGRQRLLQERATKLAEQRNDPALKAALFAKIQDDRNLPALFNKANYNKPGVAAQIAFGGIFGGAGLTGRLLGTGAAALGAGFGGPIGAQTASTIQQAVSGIIQPFKEGLKEEEEKYRKSGGAYQQSLLSIAAARQQSSRVFSAGGTQTLDIGAQLHFQERQAKEIQSSARASLLPLGIGGATEATFVRGVVSALSQRGLNPNAGDIGQITRALAGVIQTQRPQLLDNPALLNRDLQDVLSGNATARRTVLGTVLGGDAIRGLSKATSSADIVKVLSRFQSYADVQKQSTNITALQQRVTGLQEAGDTAGGSAFLEATRGGLQAQEQVLKSKDYVKAQENLGRFAGSLNTASTSVGAFAESISNKIVNGLAESLDHAIDTSAILGIFKGKGEFAQLADLLVNKPLGLQTNEDLKKSYDLAEQDKFRSNIVERLHASSSRALGANVIRTGAAGVGIDLDKIATDNEQSPQAKLDFINHSLNRFAKDTTTKSQRASLLSEKIDVLDSRFKERALSRFAPNESGHEARLAAERSELIPSQISAAQSQLALRQQELADLKKSRSTGEHVQDDDDRLRQAQRQLRNAQRLGPGTNRDNAVELAKAVVLEAKAAAKESNDLKKQGIDPEVERINRDIVTAQEQILRLKNNELSIAKEEGQLAEQRVGQAKQAYDLTTKAGLGEGGKQILSHLDQAINRLSASGASPLELGGLTRERLLSKEQNERGFQIDYSRRFAGINTQTLAGQELNTSLQIGEARETIGQNSSDSARYKNEIETQRDSQTGRHLNEVERNQRQSRIEQLDKDSAHQQVALAQGLSAQRIQPFTRASVGADLNLALKQSADVVREERTERTRLNNSLKQSVAALDNFKQRTDAQYADKDLELVNLQKSINDQGGHATIPGAGIIDDSTIGQFKLKSDVARFNLLSQQTGTQGSASGGFGANDISRFGVPGNEFQTSIKSEQDALAKSIGDTRQNLDQLSEVFAKKAAELSKTIATDKESLGGAAEPGKVPSAYTGPGSKIGFKPKYGKVTQDKDGSLRFTDGADLEAYRKAESEQRDKSAFNGIAPRNGRYLKAHTLEAYRKQKADYDKRLAASGFSSIGIPASGLPVLGAGKADILGQDFPALPKSKNLGDAIQHAKRAKIANAILGGVLGSGRGQVTDPLFQSEAQRAQFSQPNFQSIQRPISQSGAEKSQHFDAEKAGQAFAAAVKQNSDGQGQNNQGMTQLIQEVINLGTIIKQELQ